MPGRYVETRSARAALGIPTANPLRDTARKYLQKILVKLEADNGDMIPRLSEAQVRACMFVLSVYKGAVDEYAAENPPPTISIQSLSREALRDAARANLS